jgi:Type II secretion system (T2SS), protein M subtype b
MIAIPSVLLGRRGLLLVGALAALLLLVFVAMPAIAAFQAQNQERADALDQLSIFRKEVASRPAMLQALAESRLQAASMPGLMRSPTDALAAAQLQVLVKQLVEANAGDLRSAQALAPAPANGFSRIAVQCDLTLPMAHLKDLLYAVETHQPYIFIEHAEINGPLSWQGDGGKSAQSVLEVRWTVHAYRWAPPA